MKRYIFSLMMAVATIIGLTFVPPVHAYDAFSNCQSNNGEQCTLVKQEQRLSDANGVWKLIQQALIALGGIAVIVIIIGGIRYAASQGDSSSIAAAKSIILYAVIGLVVALSAAAIIGWAVSYFS